MGQMGPAHLHPHRPSLAAATLGAPISRIGGVAFAAMGTDANAEIGVPRGKPVLAGIFATPFLASPPVARFDRSGEIEQLIIYHKLEAGG